MLDQNQETGGEIDADQEAEGGEGLSGIGVNDEQVGELAQKALGFVYGSSTVFANLVSMLSSNKPVTKGIKEATIAIMDRLISEGIEASNEDLMTVGVIVMDHIFDVAVRLKLIPGVDQETLTKTAQEAVEMWMQRHGGQQQSMQQPAQQPTQQPAEAGLLGGAA